MEKEDSLKTRGRKSIVRTPRSEQGFAWHKKEVV